MSKMQINPESELSRIGGKAYYLCQLKKWCNVPPFFIVVFEDPQEILDPKKQRMILEYCRNQELNLMAVRSSASCEDSLQASFAGMFETVLCVQPPELIQAISIVLNSVSGKRVADYCEAQGIPRNKIRMAVIIQKMLHSRISGVCFTRLQNQANFLILEACYGLGEALVSGKVTPDSYIIDRRTMSVIGENTGYQKIMPTLADNNGWKLVYEEIPFHRRNSRKLSYDDVKNIARTCMKVESHLHFDAADIEWALEEDNLYMLQARPYTGFSWDCSVKGSP
jgi:pyruvate,water dikinase